MYVHLDESYHWLWCHSSFSKSEDKMDLGGHLLNLVYFQFSLLNLAVYPRFLCTYN